ncbi:vitamin B12-dependent ribonucleotide reductase [Patescibacteria group bacterium]|nr:vitamin B12-dependent ribonucleotide reductase [Patescibacteria group bacterium]
MQTRYLKKDEEGKVIESPRDLFRRVAKTMARIDFDYGASGEESAKDFYRIMTDFEFMPNTPTLGNAGRNFGQLSACFVLPIGDSIEDIFDCVKNTAIIHQTGGGTGFSFSRLRPKDDVVKSTMGRASGPISFMKVFDKATEEIKQGGVRRGANMAVLRVDHPDVLEFINCKRDLSQMTNFNISVGITDEFMKALDDNGEYELINPRNNEVSGKLKAKDVFQEIIDNAWQQGDPGIVFIDRMNRNLPVEEMGPIESTNPCGEQPLEPFGSCNLGSLNLSKMVAEDNGHSHVDYDKLRKTVRIAVRFLDNVVDANKYPLKEIERVSTQLRRIGLGVMGFADMLVKLNIPYNTSEAVRIADEVMRFVQEEAWKMSRELASKRGPFPAWERSIFAKRGEEPARNAAITTVAPTGQTSIISGCSSGIEPLFAISYVRENVLDGKPMTEVNPLFEKIAKERGFYSEQLMKKIAQKGSLQEMMEVPEDVRRAFVTSHDIAPEWHVKIQAAFQKHVDSGVSKTVNFSHDATKEDVEKVYRLAYDLGCKGVTIYRDGCRDKQVLNIAGTKELQKKNQKDRGEIEFESLDRSIIIPKKRPQMMEGKTIELETGEGDLFVTINQDEEGNPFELFATMGKSGGFSAAHTEAVGRLISLCLRSGIEPNHIIKQLKGIRGDRPIGFGPNRVLSSPDGIAKALEIYLRPPLDLEFDKDDSVKTPLVTDEDIVSPSKMYQVCCECGGTMEQEGGCAVCHDCGYSECG